MNTKPTILIIGGGVSGMTAGIYAQLNGFQTTILEKHTIAGGLLTGWSRHGYHIDGCVHWMTGTNPHKYIHKVWETIGALGKDVPVHRRDAFLRVDGYGQSHHIYRDLKKMKAEMLAISPEDAPTIEKFMDAIERFRDMEVFVDPKEQIGLWKLLKYILRLRRIKKVLAYQNISLEEIKSQFKHPLLRDAVDVYLPKEYYSLALYYMYGAFADGNADVPVGGSLQMAQRIQRRYEELGGRVRTNCAAEEIIIENGRAVGVRTAKGEELRADYVVAACDTEVTIRRLLKDRVVIPFFQQRYDNPEKYPIFAQYIAYYGCDMVPDMEDTIAFYGKPIRIGVRENRAILFKNYANEPSFAPEGKMVLQVLIQQYKEDFEYWEDLYRNDREAYKQEKMRAAEEIRQELEAHYPELKNLQVVEVVTPYSFHRFTGAHLGSYMSFMIRPSKENPHQWHNGRVEGVENLYLAGQWLQAPGGLPNAAVTGKFAIQRICKDHKMRFRE